MNRALLAERLREARLKAGLTEKDVWRRSGIAPRTIRGLEAGEHAPRLETLAALARLFGLSLDWLTGTASSDGEDG
jgi:transcriptional regulator with XRE-family HTH domain